MMEAAPEEKYSCGGGLVDGVSVVRGIVSIGCLRLDLRIFQSSLSSLENPVWDYLPFLSYIKKMLEGGHFRKIL